MKILERTIMMVHPEEDEGTKKYESDSEDEDEDGYEEIDVDIEKELYGWVDEASRRLPRTGTRALPPPPKRGLGSVVVLQIRLQISEVVGGTDFGDTNR